MNIKWILYALVGIFLFSGIFIFIDGEKPRKEQERSVQDVLKSNDDPGEVTEEILLEKAEAKIQRVIDGDTIEATVDGKQEVIRLLLIDVPELHHPDIPEQAYAADAYNYSRTYLKRGMTVTLEIGNPSRDKYGRLLAYVWANDNNFNKHMIDKGFARLVYTDTENIKYLAEFEEAEKIAKINGAKIWSVDGYVTEHGFNMEVMD